jgi:hypothetical protein
VGPSTGPYTVPQHSRTGVKKKKKKVFADIEEWRSKDRF